MIELLTAQPPPLRLDKHGTIRVGNSRVTLDTVLGAYHDGSTPEAIVEKYPAISVENVYSVIAYYLWNRTEVEKYLLERRREAAVLQEEVETRFPSTALRERLRAEREARKSSEC